MTIRELIEQLNQTDDDVKDYEVWITYDQKISADCKFMGRANIHKVPDNVDVDSERIYLKTKH